MSQSLVLASGSATRAAMLRAAGVPFEVVVARVDEETFTAGLLAEGASARDIADALAEMKAARISPRRPEAFVLGCDQTLSCDGELFSKPATPEEARKQLRSLMGRTHKLHSAAVIYQHEQPVWREVTEAKLTMGRMSDEWVDGYLGRNWESVRHSAGAYRIEEEGVRLFTKVEGDHFTILGLPLLPLLSFLTLRGTIPS
ncbi:Septum formation protein Maf [Rubellimicrobium mesophilum DSM 19309]|uniref:Nucleoside triphosphate pyrophosphatase n=1 Tax=Rubellimicrobium mesophilum DSM 19309 TaxID=442562 RepID=A0A017HI41_9RHOB|nr:nucleoside triphosphate pyrophosphatase [Rubellimicrobium mesophilum]EYD74157.1 Septum formation protein Maf [Rubellimicrobium mesophilum DSM 19309]